MDRVPGYLISRYPKLGGTRWTLIVRIHETNKWLSRILYAMLSVCVNDVMSNHDSQPPCRAVRTISMSVKPL